MEGPVKTQNMIPENYEKHLDVVRFNKDGGLILATSSRNSRLWNGSLWYYTNIEKVHSCPEPGDYASAVGLVTGINDVCWVSDKVIVAAYDSGAVGSWKVNSENKPFQPLWESREHDHLVSSVSFYEHDDVVVSASYDGQVKIWQLEDDMGTCVHTYKGHTDIIWSIDNHKMQPIFATCSMDGSVIVWDTRQAKPATRYSQFLQVGPLCVRWQYGTDLTLAVGDTNGHIHIADLRRTDSEARIINAHKRAVNVLEFCEENTSMLATGSEDCTVKVFDIQTDNAESVYCGQHRDYVRSASWRSGSELISCSYDGTLLARHVLSKRNHHTMDVNGVDT